MSGEVKRKSLRQSLGLLHTWAGLPLGWLMFLIFVSGALSYYRQEITLWMQPELHVTRAGERSLERTVEVLREKAPRAASWAITLPNARAPYYTVAWPAPPAPQAEAVQGHVMPIRSIVDPSTGTVLQPRETAGGGFLYRLHFRLYGMDNMTGRAVVGAVTLIMLLALVSGLFVHHNIFKDFFMFRPGRGKISWRDAHNAGAVIAFPFHIMITFSGLVLLSTTLMGPVISANYDNPRDFMMESRGAPAQPTQNSQNTNRQQGGEGAGGRPQERGEGRGGSERRQPETVRLTELDSLLAQGNAQWKQGVGNITISNPDTARAIVELREIRSESLVHNSVRTLRFSGVTGEALPLAVKPDVSVVKSIWAGLNSLHRGFFASPLARFLLFISGCLGAGMIASGLIIWSVNRKKHEDAFGRFPLGQQLVDILNIAAIPGLFTAIAAYLWISRVIPASLPGRSDGEIGAFFAVWSLCLVHATLRGSKKKAWAEQFAAAGTMTMLLPVVNALTGGAHLGASISGGLWAVAGFDLVALFFGGMFIFGALKIARHAHGGARQIELGHAAESAGGLMQPEHVVNKMDARSVK